MFIGANWGSDIFIKGLTLSANDNSIRLFWICNYATSLARRGYLHPKGQLDSFAFVQMSHSF